MKIHILYNFRDEPWGGGNQFLCALRSQWRTQGIYAEESSEADVILFNSYPFGAPSLFAEAFRIKRARPEVAFVHRLNGPISLIRGTDVEVDRMIAFFNRTLCDGIVFQSRWCQTMNHELFQLTSEVEDVIHNAPDPALFFPASEPIAHSPVRLIATSWSANPRKGFEAYAYLDKHLDHSRYQMTFVGNSPISFENIIHKPAVDSREVAALLREHDVFVTASQKDPCSNSLIEALSCGLPAVALADGGHPELVQDGGELFTTHEELLRAIDRVGDNLSTYRAQLPTFNIVDVARQYEAVCQSALQRALSSSVSRGSYLAQLRLSLMRLAWRARRLRKRLWNR